MTKQEARTEMAAIYESLAQRPLERTCISRTECCQFHLTGKTPLLTRGEALFAAQGVRASGRKNSRSARTGPVLS